MSKKIISLDDHERVLQQTKALRCWACKILMPSEPYLRQHMAEKHPGWPGCLPEDDWSENQRAHGRNPQPEAED